MRFSTGRFDALFGEKAEIEVRQDDGTLRKVRVSKAWLQKMKDSGQMTKAPENAVHVHIIGPDGLEHGQLIVGKDIPEDRFKKLVDPETSALYALKVYEQGTPSITVISREMWEAAKRAMDAA